MLTLRTALKIWGVLLLGSGLLIAVMAGPSAPPGADAAIGIHLGALLRHPGLTTLADSGEIGEITKSLKVSGIQFDKRNVPDVVLLFFGVRDRMLLTAAPQYQILREQLQKRYGKAKNVDIEDTPIAGLPAFKITVRSIRTNRVWRVCELVYLSSDVVAIGSKNDPLPRQKLNAQYASAYRELLQGEALVSGVAANPSAFRLDPFGIAAGLHRIEFEVREQGTDLTLAVRGETVSPEAAQNTATMVQNLARILLVSFFGSDPELFQQVAATLHTTPRNSEVVMDAVWSSELIEKISRFYAGNREKFSSTLQTPIAPAPAR